MTDETNTVIEIHPKVLIDAALKYAERGFRVLPLHTIKSGICSCGEVIDKHIAKAWNDGPIFQ
jgi:hypothetical protein